MSYILQTLAQTYTYDTTSAETSMSPAVVILYVAFAILMFAASWKMYEKAKKPGWAAIIPIYSTLVWLQFIGRPWWWLLLHFIPVVNVIILIIMLNDTAKVFGKGTGTTLLLFFLPFIGYPMLGFGDAKYKAPKRS